VILFLGIISVIAGMIVLPLGIVPWVLGSRALNGMRQGRIDPSGKGRAQIGRVLGIVGVFAFVACLVNVFLAFAWDRNPLMIATSAGEDNVRITIVYYPESFLFGEPRSRVVEWEYVEVLQADGSWMRDGPATRRSRRGAKLECGVLHDGKREGEWLFWNEDGSIDNVKTGNYINDVKCPAAETDSSGISSTQDGM
jgi:hypothetical protein